MDFAFDPISAGIGLVSSAVGFMGARKARKAQEKFMKAQMKDRAKRIADAKEAYAISRIGLQAQNRAMMNAALKSSPMTLGASMARSTALGNLQRAIFQDYAARGREIERETAAGQADLNLLSPFDVVDAGAMGAARGAEAGFLANSINALGSSFINKDMVAAGAEARETGRMRARGKA